MNPNQIILLGIGILNFKLLTRDDNFIAVSFTDDIDISLALSQSNETIGIFGNWDFNF